MAQYRAPVLNTVPITWALHRTEATSNYIFKEGQEFRHRFPPGGLTAIRSTLTLRPCRSYAKPLLDLVTARYAARMDHLAVDHDAGVDMTP